MHVQRSRRSIDRRLFACDSARWISATRYRRAVARVRLRSNAAVLDADDPIAQIDQALIVRDQNATLAALVHFAGEFFHHLSSSMGVETGSWLIGQDDARIVHQRPGNRDALSLAAGERGRMVPGAVAHVQLAQQEIGAAASLIVREIEELTHEEKLLSGGQVGNQVRTLKNKPDLMQPEVRSLASAGPGKVDAGQARVSGRRCEQCARYRKKRGLPRSRRADQSYQLALCNLEVDIDQCVDTRISIAIVLRDILELED